MPQASLSTSTMSAVLAIVACFASAASTPSPAPKPHFEAWLTARSIPLFVDRSGVSPAWQEMGPGRMLNGWNGSPDSGRMTSIAVDPTDSRTIYASAASGGLWKTIDQGKSWKPLADQEPSLSYGAIAIDHFDHKTIYAGMGEANNSGDSFQGAGFMRSQDSGAHWSLLGVDVFLGQRFSRIVPSLTRPKVVFAACTRGVMRSTDSGGTWVNLLKGVATDLIIDSRDPHFMMAAIGASNGSPANGLYKTTDGGANWTKLTKDLPFPGTELGRLQFGQCASQPNVVYAAMYSHGTGLLGLMKSEDFGESWLLLPGAPSYAGGSAWYYNVVAVAPENPNVLFLGGTTTYRSEDGGRTWMDDTRSYGDGYVHPDHHFITFDPSNPKRLYLATDGGIFTSDDLGDTWTDVNHNLATVQFQFVDVHPTDPSIAYGGTQDNGTDKYTGSMDWTNVYGGDGGFTRLDPVHPDTVYAEYVNLVMYKTTDGGKNWTWDVTNGIDRSEGALFYAPFNLDPENPSVLVAGTRRVYRTTDGADHWSPISPFLGLRVSALTIAPNNSAVIYAGTNDGHLWVTPDTGTKWFEIGKGLPPKSYIADICVDPTDARKLVVSFSAWDRRMIWKTDDAGTTWTDLTGNLPDCPVRSLVLNPKDPNQLFAGTEIGVFVTDLRFPNWSRYGSGLPNAPVFSIVANKNTGFLTVGTHGRGAWRIPLPATETTAAKPNYGGQGSQAQSALPGRVLQTK